MNKSDERSIDARISELQALARSCSDRMLSASLKPAAPVANAPRFNAPRQAPAPIRVPQAQMPVYREPAARPQPVEALALRPSVLPEQTVTHLAADPHCPDFLWREAHGRYAATEQNGHFPVALHPAGEKDARPWHKMPVFRASLLPHFTYVGRAAAVILLAGTMALFLVTWKNSPVSAVVSSEDMAIAHAVQGGHLGSNANAARKVTLEKIVMKPEDNGFNTVQKPQDAAKDVAAEKEQNKLVKTITLAGMTPGQFIDKSWPIPGVEGAEAAQITQIKTEQSSVELAQVEATGATNYLARGEMLLRTGDIASARLMFRKASEMGDARGAIGIASTYDPNVLRTLPVYGMAGNADTARNWYEKAKELGAASEATARLEALSRL